MKLSKECRDELIRYLKTPTKEEIRRRTAFIKRAEESTKKSVRRVSGKTILTVNLKGNKKKSL